MCRNQTPAGGCKQHQYLSRPLYVATQATRRRFIDLFDSPDNQKAATRPNDTGTSTDKLQHATSDAPTGLIEESPPVEQTMQLPALHWRKPGATMAFPLT